MFVSHQLRFGYLKIQLESVQAVTVTHYLSKFCPTLNNSQGGYRFTLCCKNNRAGGKWYVASVLLSRCSSHSVSFFGKWKGWERKDSSSLPNVQCLFLLLLLFLFLDIPVATFSTGQCSGIPHYCHINSAIVDMVGHTSMHISDKVTGNLFLADVAFT